MLSRVLSRWFVKSEGAGFWSEEFSIDEEPSDETVLAATQDAMKHSYRQSLRYLIFYQVGAVALTLFYIVRGLAEGSSNPEWHIFRPRCEIYAGAFQVVVGTPVVCMIKRKLSTRKPVEQDFRYLFTLPLFLLTICCLLTEDTVVTWMKRSSDVAGTLMGAPFDDDHLSIDNHACGTDTGNLGAFTAASGFLIMLVVPGDYALATAFASLCMYFVPIGSMSVSLCKTGVGNWIDDALPHIILVCGLALTFSIIRRRQETMCYQMFLLANHYRRKWIGEKVLRCSDEFNATFTHGQCGEPAMEYSCGISYTQSAATGPAAVLAASNDANCFCSSLLNDCIPENYHVQVEGQAAPLPVAGLKPGQRVLSMDSVTCMPRFVEVKDVEIADSPAVWTSVTLEDNTMLAMTEDHPVWVRNAGHSATWSAQDLEPEKHSMMCLRQVSVPVKIVSVSPSSDASIACMRRVAVTLQQGQRFSLLVNAKSDSPSPTTTSFAVGSVDLSCGEWMQNNTTYRYTYTKSSGKREKYRSESDPGKYPATQHATNYDELPCSPLDVVVTAEQAPQDGLVTAETSIGTTMHGTSIGTARHGTDCVPCKFYRSKRGCQKGQTCEMCHSSDHENASYGNLNKKQKLQKRDAKVTLAM